MFGCSKVLLEGAMSQDDLKLSRSMVDYWSSFSRYVYWMMVWKLKSWRACSLKGDGG